MIIRISASTGLFSAKKRTKSPCILRRSFCCASDINNDLYSAKKKEDEGWMRRERGRGRATNFLVLPFHFTKKRATLAAKHTQENQWMLFARREHSIEWKNAKVTGATTEHLAVTHSTVDSCRKKRKGCVIRCWWGRRSASAHSSRWLEGEEVLD